MKPEAESGKAVPGTFFAIHFKPITYHRVAI
jgi:hypothetical protein